VSFFEPVERKHFTAILEFCDTLKADEHPCSFWMLSSENIASLLQPGKIAHIALENSIVVGLGTLTIGGKFQSHWAEISVAVTRLYQGRGVASALVSSLEASAQQIDIKLIKALILENNKPSRKFFARSKYVHKATLYDEFLIPDLGLVNDCVYYKSLC
jgi:RimJ/RimL family protein N-acetyltransferase